jgi:acetyl esterase/lipase
MTRIRLSRAFIISLAAVGLASTGRAVSPVARLLAGHKTIKLWPHETPKGCERLTSSHQLTGGRTVLLLTGVSVPTLTVFAPPASQNAHAAVLVFPGGGYQLLAFDLEGTEICHWLNSLGITAFLVKYSVPESPAAPPLRDAQRALGVVRFQASKWQIDPQRIGVIGFSAGGDLAALLSNNFSKRAYPPVDDADRESCRPDFAMLIYPAYLVTPSLNALVPQLRVTSNTPPTFLIQTEDDPIHVENAIEYFMALKRAKVPAELHVYSHGGHGYGLRPTQLPVTRWPRLAARWLRSQGILK